MKVKNIKSYAKQILKNNYKEFLLPTLLFIILNTMGNGILNIITHISVWDKLNVFYQQFIIVFFVFLSFVLKPFSIALLFYFGKQLLNNNKPNIKELLTTKIILKLIGINLIPCFITILYSLQDAKNSVWNFFEADLVLFGFLLFFQEFIEYKFFVCNYFFVPNESSVIKTIQISFNTMKKTYLKTLWLQTSFIIWEILIACIYLLFLSIVQLLNMDSIFWVLLLPFGFGINLYVIPYKYISFSIYSNELLSNT